MDRVSRSSVLLVAVRALLLLNVSACSMPGGGSDSAGSRGAKETVQVDDQHESFVSLLRHVQFDFEPAVDLDDIIARSRAVVRGRIVDVANGRTVGATDGDPAGHHHVVLKLEVAKVFYGQAGRYVYIEIPRSMSTDAARYAASLSRQDSGTEDVLAFLADAATYKRIGKIVGQERGRPSHEPLLRLTSPQSLILQTVDGITLPFSDDERHFLGDSKTLSQVVELADTI